MWSEIVNNLVARPRYGGPLEGATQEGLAGTPGDGPFLRLWLAVEEGTIRRAAYQTFGCPAAIASGELLCLIVRERTCEWARGLTPEDLTRALHGLPEGKEHCPRLAIDALRQALTAGPT